MEKIDIYILKSIRDYKLAKVWPIWKVMTITKTFIGFNEPKYVIWYGKKILGHADTYRQAIRRRREIWNLA